MTLLNIDYVPGKEIEALGHDMTFVPAKEATCTEDGNVAYYECANCGKTDKVPFEPRNDKPVYCSECFAKMKEE